jgi:hypothetical protein
VVTNATQSQWNGARLRLRWEYAINASEEAIRLDPNAPSIAVGNPLPTDYLDGGAGFWTGKLSDGSGAYAVRIGDPTGPNARFDGSNFRIADSSGADVFYFPSTPGANAYIGAPVNLAAAGGVWQGTGGSPSSFSNPYNGIKIWNESGAGRFGLWNAGTQHMTLRYDRGLEVANDGSADYHSGLTFTKTQNGTIYGSLQGYVEGAYYISAYEVKDGSRYAAVVLQASSGNSAVSLQVDDNYNFALSKSLDSARLQNLPLHISESGLTIGTITDVNQGQIIADAANAHDYNLLFLRDTGGVAHGMTSLATTGTYGTFGKASDANGGLAMLGISADVYGVWLRAAGTGASTSEGTGSAGTVIIDAYKRDGSTANVTSLAADDNVLAVRNNGACQFIVKGDGKLFANDVLAAYDEYDDVGLVRALALTRNPAGVVRSEYDKWVHYNRADLERLNLISAGGFRNITGLQELHNGAIWQLHERLSRLEAAING